MPFHTLHVLLLLWQPFCFRLFVYSFVMRSPAHIFALFGVRFYLCIHFKSLSSFSQLCFECVTKVRARISVHSCLAVCSLARLLRIWVLSMWHECESLLRFTSTVCDPTHESHLNEPITSYILLLLLLLPMHNVVCFKQTNEWTTKRNDQNQKLKRTKLKNKEEKSKGKGKSQSNSNGWNVYPSAFCV